MVKAFISYAHTDAHYKDELEKHLATLRRNGEIESWTDTMISPSEVWNESISKSLNSADLIICLISSDFINSDYCYEIEMKDALLRHKEGKAQIIPIIIRSCDWSDTPFAQLQVLPTLGKPIHEWPDQDQAYLNVIEGLKKSIRAMSAPFVQSITKGTTAPNATDDTDDPHTGYVYPSANKGKVTAPTGFAQYTPGEKAAHRKRSRKMTYIYIAIGVVIVLVALRMIFAHHSGEQLPDDQLASKHLTDDQEPDDHLAQVHSLTKFIKHYTTQQLVILGIIGAIAGKVIGDLLDTSFSLLVNILIGVIAGFIGLWLFGSYVNLTHNTWLNDTLTIATSALILMLPIKLIRGMFK